MSHHPLSTPQKIVRCILILKALLGWARRPFHHRSDWLIMILAIALASALCPCRNQVFLGVFSYVIRSSCNQNIMLSFCFCFTTGILFTWRTMIHHFFQHRSTWAFSQQMTRILWLLYQALVCFRVLYVLLYWQGTRVCTASELRAEPLCCSIHFHVRVSHFGAWRICVFRSPGIYEADRIVSE